MRPVLKALCLVATLLPTWVNAGEIYIFQQPHMGCLFTLKVVAGSEQQAEAAAQAVSKRIEEIEQICSDYRPDSEISLLGATAGHQQGVEISPDLLSLLAASEHWWQWSGGAFDVTLGPCTRLWRTSRKSQKLPDSSTLTDALAATGFPKLHFSASAKTVRLERVGMVLDFGGIAKGYALDAATQLLRTNLNLNNFLIDAGGQIAAMGAPPGKDAWHLGIEKLPEEKEDTPDVVLKLSDAHLATSGDINQKVTIAGQSYAHIIDPKTGLGLTYTVQASVIADDGTTADAVATALCIMEESEAKSKLMKLPNVAARVLRQSPNGQLDCWQTENWQTYVK